MLKYLRIGFALFIEFFTGFLWVIIPNIFLKRHRSLKSRYRGLRTIIFRLSKVLRMEVIINGFDFNHHPGPYFIVATHQSMLDPFLMIYLFSQPIRFIAKKEARRLPMFGEATASIDTIYIDRKDVRSQVRSLKLMRESLIRQENNWLAFPEGTRNKNQQGQLLEFKAGTFKQAMEAKATILPLVTFGCSRPLNPHLKWRKYPIQVTALNPIPYSDYAGLSTIEFAKQIQSAMQVQSDKMLICDKEWINHHQ